MAKKREIYFFIKNRCYLSSGNSIKEIDTAPKKSLFLGAFAPEDRVFSFSSILDISKLEDPSLSVKMELNFYEGGGLDREQEYIFAHYKHIPTDGNRFLYTIFAIKKDDIVSELHKCIKSHQSIDLVTLPYFIYEPLYRENSLPSQRDSELIFRFDENYFWAVFYHEGRFVDAKLFPDISKMAMRLKVDIEDFKEYIQNYGFKSELWPNSLLPIKEQLFQLFDDNLQRVNRSITQRCEQLSIPYPKHIRLDSSFGLIPGFWDICRKNGFIEIKKSLLEPPENIESLHPYLDALYFKSLDKTALKNTPNLTPSPRLPPWYTTYTGHQILTFLFALFVVGSVGGVELYFLDKEQKKVELLKAKVSKEKSRINSELSKINKKKAKLKTLQERLKDIESEIGAWRESAILALEIKNSSLNRRELEKSVDLSLKAENIHCERFVEFDNSKIIVNLIVPSSQSYRIGSFMHRLKGYGYKEVNSKLIQRDDSNYRSQVRIVK